MNNASSAGLDRQKMPRLTIFARLTLSYVLIFSLVTGMVLYAVFEFQRLNSIARQLQEVDRRIFDYADKLTDTLLSETRYEKKFIITRAPAHLDQFGQFTQDFQDDLNRLLAVALYPDLREWLARVGESHKRYQYVFAEEINHLKAGRDYSQLSYQREKEKAVDESMTALQRIISFAKQNTGQMLNQMEATTARARTLSLALTALFLVLGVGTSFLITQSITRPVSLLKEKSKRIAEGHLTGDLELPSVPEIKELAATFNLMCDKLRDLDRMKTEFFFSLSKKLCVPLTSIKERIDFLSDEVAAVLSPNQKIKMAILAEESAHLIGIINSLVELSKMESGLTTYNFELTPLATVIDQTLADVAPLAKTKEIALKNESSDTLPKIKMDAAKIVQALRTLIGNALKLTASGGSLTVASRPIDQGVQVSITGTALVKEEKKLAPLFDLVDAPNAANGDYGAELGWAMAQHIIRSHGGSLWVETNPHQGSTFSFVLPS